MIRRMGACLLVTVLSLFAGCDDEQTPPPADMAAPVPGNSGTLTASSVAEMSLDLNWTSATDNITAVANLQYKVVQSAANNIDTVANAEANGVLVQDWTANITTTPVTGLVHNTTYYFNVLVRDEALNIAAYTAMSQATALDDPPVPGNSGTLMTSGVTETSLDLNWTEATDAESAQANLEYIVYYSTSNNIATVANAEVNGTAVGSYAADIATKPVTGLTSSTTYYFNTLVKDEIGNKVAYTTVSQMTADGTSPTPGNSGTLTTASVAETSLTLNWTSATDNITAAANLQYKVVQSAANNIDTVADAETNGTPVQDWTANITTTPVTGLVHNTTYYFNVIVRDEALNKAVYATVSESTLADSTSPTPGGSGILTFSGVGSTSITVDWTKATDDFSAQANLDYIVYYSTSNNIATVANAEGNGTAVGSYVADIATKPVTGLTPSSTYYFNVIVRDEAGNREAYTSDSQATAP